MLSSLYVLSLQPFSMCMFLIHINVSTCVNVPINIDLVTTQNKCYLDILSALVSLENTILSPTHG